ncbi:MAG: hypothetical protein C0518_02795 [Opitutus sp.]|nr:hypothetical protein [Opitutus sp.]
MQNSSPDPLASVLDRWGAPPAVPPLARDVRLRLAGPGRERVPPSPFFPPAFAAVFLAACILLGLFLAELRVTEQHRQRDARLLESYRRLIDPLLTASPFPPETSGLGRT